MQHQQGEHIPTHSLGRYFFLIAGLLLLLLFTASCIDRGRSLNSKQKGKLKAAVLKKAPKPRFPLNAVFSLPASGGKKQAILLYGIDIKPFPLKRGKKATITYYFKALRRMKAPWGIFLHMEGGPENPKWMRNLDHKPLGGIHPTHKWKKNQILRSSHSFVMPKEFPGSETHFYSGLWRGNQRMQLPKNLPSDGRNRLLLAKVKVKGKGLSKPIYVAYKIDTPPKIDGKIDDPIWAKIPSTGRFPSYNNRKTRFRTEAKLAWDDKYLYVAFLCEDDDIWSTFKKRDDPLFKQENVELFIDANRNHKDYIELQVSPAGVIFDSFFEKYRYPRPWGRLSYDSGMLTKVSINGTLNNKKDVDKGWTVEIRLPFSKLGPAPNLPPKNADEWLINMFRLEVSRRTGADYPAWSPVTLARSGDYHQLSRFGTLRFSTKVRSVKAKKAKKAKLLAPKKLRLAAPNMRPQVIPGARQVKPRRLLQHIVFPTKALPNARVVPYKGLPIHPQATSKPASRPAKR